MHPAILGKQRYTAGLHGSFLPARLVFGIVHVNGLRRFLPIGRHICPRAGCVASERKGFHDACIHCLFQACLNSFAGFFGNVGLVCERATCPPQKTKLSLIPLQACRDVSRSTLLARRGKSDSPFSSTCMVPGTPSLNLSHNNKATRQQ